MEIIEKLKKELLVAIQEKIKREGFSQSEAGRLCGVSRTHMNNILRETSAATGLGRLLRIASGIGLKIELKIRDSGKGKEK